jgi:hypothetical protein
MKLNLADFKSQGRAFVLLDTQAQILNLFIRHRKPEVGSPNEHRKKPYPTPSFRRV